MRCVQRVQRRLTRRSGLRFYSVGRKGHAPFNWNPLRGPPGVHPKTWTSVVAEALEKSHLLRPRCGGYIFIETFDKQFEDFGFYDGTVDQYPDFFDVTEELECVQVQWTAHAVAG
jgi:hypothetical protein